MLKSKSVDYFLRTVFIAKLSASVVQWLEFLSNDVFIHAFESWTVQWSIFQGKKY